MGAAVRSGYVHTVEPISGFPEPTIVDMSNETDNIHAIPLSDAVSDAYLKHATAMAAQLRKIDSELRRCAISNYGTYDSVYSTDALLKNLCEIMYSYPQYHTLPQYDEDSKKGNAL